MNKKITDLKTIYKPISNEISLVESELKKQANRLTANQSNLRKTIKYFFSIPGKRLRPALTVLSAKACNPSYKDKDNKLVLLSTIVEFVHAASLIHDDIIDSSEYRRNQVTLNRKFTNQIAVLTGDLTYTSAFSLLVNNFNREIIMTFINCIEQMCKGEIFNLFHEKLTIPQYLTVIEAKTASLMSTSCKTGALLVSKSNEKIKMLEDIGYNFGMAYQLIDDHLDNDIPEISDQKKKKMALNYISKAKRITDKLNKSIYQKSLSDLLDFLIKRSGAE